MRKKLFIIFAAAMLFIQACNSTRISHSWRDPETTVSMDKLNKVLVVALLRNEGSRRAAEDKMATLLHGNGVVSYNYLDRNVNVNDENAIRDKLRGDGFDGAVTMRLVDVEKDVTYTPGTISTYPVTYRTFGGYYRTVWQTYSTPDRYSKTKTFTVETNVYSIKQDKIIWTGLTESTDPGGAQKMTEEISKVVYNRMIKEGFIAK